ncbi:MAG: hypothetical protein M1825_004194 [Sarcosagium campestre]|nr:MAG: hypothetical protein M1825_004194 [Sarcosagium campestre]
MPLSVSLISQPRTTSSKYCNQPTLPFIEFYTKASQVVRCHLSDVRSPVASFFQFFLTTRHQFSTSSTNHAREKPRGNEYRHPYLLAQARQRKAANVARQATLQKERNALLGDPVRSKPTPFIKMLDGRHRNRRSTSPSSSASETSLSIADDIPLPPHLNHYITPAEFRESVEYSRRLTEPVPSQDRSLADPVIEAESAKLHADRHRTAVAAMVRIADLSRGSTQDRKRVQIQHCIDTFGRHNTDSKLAPRPASSITTTTTTATTDDFDGNVEAGTASLPTKIPRAGPDTGSSEVQIAVLTAKIRGLDRHLNGRGKMDKVNKRNLRLLVHKRQKLLKYLRRSERGGERWQYVMQTLGLSDAAWKGEISM